VNYEGVEPTEENIASHKYKFSADEHIYTLKTAAPEVKAFVAYAAAQRAILKDGGIVAAIASPTAARDFVTFVNAQHDTLASFGIY
jgi:ABC-type phosphate transport system substrate-binding protein